MCVLGSVRSTAAHARRDTECPGSAHPSALRSTPRAIARFRTSSPCRSGNLQAPRVRHQTGISAARTECITIGEIAMFSWAIAFFVIALIAAIFGFFGIAASAAGIAKIIFVVALILALVSFVAGRRPVV